MCQLSLLCQAENSSKLARTKAGVSSSVPAKQRASALVVICISVVLIVTLLVTTLVCCRKEKPLVEDENDETPERYKE